MSQKTILFLINQNAGNGLPKNFEKILQSKLQVSNIAFEISFSEYAGHLEILAKEGVKNGYKSIVVAGGDGSINEVFKAILGTDVKLGILPLGSGNGLARHLGIPFTIEKSLKLILKGKSKAIDTATINDNPFISIAGTGFDAFIAMHFADSSLRGFWNYFRLVIKHYLFYKPLEYQISSNEKKTATSALFISCANSNQFGNNISIAPKAIIDDGLLDITIIKKPPFFILPFTIILLLRRKIYKSKYAESFKTKSLVIKAENSPLINIDGEFQETLSPINIKIVPSSINLIVP